MTAISQSVRSLEVVTTAHPVRWNEVLAEVGTYCFYNLASFHRLSELRGHGRAEMLVYRDGGYTIIYPMLVREIDLAPAVTAEEGFRDATSVPGLVGPLASAATVPEEVRRRFTGELQAYFEENRVITAYCRLNCLLDRQPLFEGYGQTVTHGVEISVDLTIPPEAQFARCRKDIRRDVKRLIRDGFSFEEVGVEYLDDFMRIYYDTMDRKHAAAGFYFDRAFFEYLMNEMSDVTHLFVTKDGERIAAMAIYMECNGVVHSYLSGTESHYMRASPSKLLRDSARRWAVKRGCRMLHMGAGSGTQRDSLWEYKMAFGGREHEYSTWRHVVDPQAYEDICREVIRHAGMVPDDAYFPAYRSPGLLAAGPEVTTLREAQS